MEVEREDLEFVLGALNTARYKSVSEDMAESYRQMDARGKPSPFTKHLEQAISRLEACMIEEEEGENDVSE